MTTRRQDARAARAETLEQLQLEGLSAAYRRGIQILEDDSAPATAHAQIVRIFFAASGVGNADADLPEKDPHEMTGEELEAATQEIVASLRDHKKGGGSVMD